MVLLDELGSSTDPASGSAIARAILEYLIETGNANNCASNCRVIATTHSPQLKMLPLSDDRFRCASVLLHDRSSSICDGASTFLNQNADFLRHPSFKLSYDVSGDSYLLGAATRCEPPLSKKNHPTNGGLLHGWYY